LGLWGGKMKNKSKMILSAFGMVFGITFLVVSIFLAENKMIHSGGAAVLVAIAIILFFAAVIFFAKIDCETSSYECRSCGHIFKPVFIDYIMGMHSLKTRRLKCPECGQKTWCKRKNKE